MDRRAIFVIGALLLAFALMEQVRTPGDDEEDEPAKPREPAAELVRCDATSSVRAQAPTRRDAVLGPVTIGGFRRSFERAKESELYVRGPAGVKGLKAPVVFAGGRDVTISVPPRYRSLLGLDYDVSARGVDTVAEAEPAVRFQACPPAPGRATGHAGGLLWGGPWPACVALDVAVAGRPSTRHALSLGAGPCPRP